MIFCRFCLICAVCLILQPNPGTGYPKDYRAYYSDFVKCGETISDIDPQDWYE